MIYERKGKNLETDIAKLGIPKWQEHPGPERETLRLLTSLAFIGLAKAYETASKVKDFRHRNWFRNRENLDAIKSDLKFIRDIKFSENETGPIL